MIMSSNPNCSGLRRLRACVLAGALAVIPSGLTFSQDGNRNREAGIAGIRAVVAPGEIMVAKAMSAAHTQENVPATERALREKYQGKTITLRQSYEGRQLTFGPDGNLVGYGRIGSWTTCAELEVEKLTLDSHNLTIQGRRLLLKYDRESKQFVDIGDSSEIRALPQRMVQGIKNAQQIRIAVQLAQQGNRGEALTAALARIFLDESESLADVAPECWRLFLKNNSAPTMQQIRDAYSQKELGYSVHFPRQSQEVVEPRPLQRPLPRYTEMARMGRVSGSVVLSIIIDQNGNVVNPLVVLPLGLELEESAIAQLAEWKFEPGRIDGRPVCIQAHVEITFRLY